MAHRWETQPSRGYFWALPRKEQLPWGGGAALACWRRRQVVYRPWCNPIRPVQRTKVSWLILRNIKFKLALPPSSTLSSVPPTSFRRRLIVVQSAVLSPSSYRPSRCLLRKVVRFTPCSAPRPRRNIASSSQWSSFAAFRKPQACSRANSLVSSTALHPLRIPSA